MKSRKLSSQVIFWVIVSSAIIVVMVIFTASLSYQSHKEQAEATIAAAPTATAEFMEIHYQKGIGYMNIGRWVDARAELEMIFEIDPNYKDVQTRLIEIYTKIDQLTPFPTSALSIQLERTPSQPGGSSPVSFSDGLVAYYPFNGNALDESINDNHGKVYGAVLTDDRFGNRENAYHFNGNDNRIEIANNFNVNFSSGDFSIVGWLKTSHIHNDNNGLAIIDKYPQNGKPWTIRIQPDGKIRFLSDNSVYSKTAVNDGLWHHFVAQRSKSTIQLFIDGQLQGTALSTTSASNSMLLCIGCIHDHSLRRLFNGTIDDIRIYNRTLTEAEIQLLYKESES